MQIPYTRWGGAAVAGALGDYTDIKMTPKSSTLTNSELLAVILAGLTAFNVAPGSKYRPALDGGADWGIGVLGAGIARRRLMPAATVTTTVPTTTTAPVTTTVTPAVTASSGVPASGGSAAFDLPVG